MKMKNLILVLWLLSFQVFKGVWIHGEPLICHRVNDSKPIGYPKVFEAHIEITDFNFNNTSEVVEYSNLQSTALYRTAGGNLTMCRYGRHDKQGHIVRGVKCQWVPDMPRQCFCDGACIPFVPLSDVFAYMQQHGAVLVNDSLKIRGGIPASQWALRCWGQHNRNITLTIDAYFSRRNHPMPTGRTEVPVRVTILGQGDLLGLWESRLTNVKLVYEITRFRSGPIQNKEVFLPPPGVYCPTQKITKPLPKMADLFSVTMETILSDKKVISYVHHNYDFIEKLVSYTLQPHHHSPVSLGRAYIIPDTGGLYRIIHDFKTGIQYMIDEKTSNCTISPIPLTAFDAAPVDDSHVRLRHANELLNLEVEKFVYSGERIVRGVPCDVWVVEKPTNDRGEYITLEIYFSQENWVVEVEVVNEEQQAPMGISTYIAKSHAAQNFFSVVHTYYFGYTLGHPDWSNFDISQCLNRINRLFLILTLKVSYSELVQYSLEVAEDAIRRAISALAGVSPLRITNLFLANNQQSQEVDVWFVLLEHPDVVGDVQSPSPPMPLKESFNIMHKLTDENDVGINLDFSPHRKMGVTIKRGSLETTSESLHPNTRHRSTHYLKAGYTAGSMAGLGFSMAILGMCIGIFIGFLLWKRGTGVPYQVHD